MIEMQPFHSCDYCAPVYERNEETTRLYRGVNGACICHACLGRIATRWGGTQSGPGITNVVEHGPKTPRVFK